MLSTSSLTQAPDEAYVRLMEAPVISRFIVGGGKVFAATEGIPKETVERLLELGHRHFAEKYLQEAEVKYADLLYTYPDLHLSYFGKLQTNKIDRIFRLFHTIESVSRVKEVDFLRAAMARYPGREREFFVQCNIGQEEQKNGVPAAEIPHLMDYATAAGVRLTGLMVIPPKFGRAAAFFRKAKDMADKHGLRECQMGFSADFEEAIDCGASRVRISRLIFGQW